MVRISGGISRAQIGALFLVAAFLCGCATSRPQKNVFVWDLKNDHRVHHHAQVASTTHRTTTASNTRHTPGWYTPPARSNQVAVKPLPAPRDDVTPQQTALDTGTLRFVWPVQGRIIADFGTNANGERNDGINIATALGAPIHAAAAGTVTYAGNELKGYGNLILIRHDDGYVTAYAHAEQMLVTRNDSVSQGQVIGYSGDTGDVTEPQLHFEIRHGVEPVNPRPLLVASR
jgi:murein DD-endopeptidase MepM/ murein hydrolase activator NlpD